MVYAEKMSSPTSSPAPSTDKLKALQQLGAVQALPGCPARPETGPSFSAGLHAPPGGPARPRRGCIPPTTPWLSLEGLSPPAPSSIHAVPVGSSTAAHRHTSGRLGVCPLNIGGSGHRYCHCILAGLIGNYSSWLSLPPQACFEDLIRPLPLHCDLERLSPSVPPPSVRPSLNLASPLLRAFFFRLTR